MIWLDLEPAEGTTVERVMPRGAVDLVFELGDAKRSVRGAQSGASGAVVAGPRTTAFALASPAGSRTLGVCLTPGTASAVLGASVHELRDRHVALADLWGSCADELAVRLRDADAPGEQIAAVEAALLARLRRCDRVPHPAARHGARRVAAAPVAMTGARLRRTLGLSERRVEQIFRTEVGLTPKQYGSLERFRSAARGVDRAMEIGWAAFAVERGYYDQSHLCNAFRAHAGVTPREYVAARGPNENHLRTTERCGFRQDGTTSA